MKKRILLILCMGLSLQNLQSQTSKSAAKLSLENEIAVLQKDPALRNAAWGLYVYNISRSQVEADYNSEMSLMPASVMKILTTSTALSLLGSDFRFQTRLQYSGRIDSAQGMLYGNLYLTGGGDPTLGSKRFNQSVNADTVFSIFAQSLIQSGIHHVEGKLIADESIFDDRIPQSWSYEDIGNYYAPPVCGLSIYENMFRIYFDAGAAIGDSVKISGMNPEVSEIKFINMVSTGAAGTGDQVIISGNPFTYLRVLDGTIPAGKKHFDVDGSLPDPARTCAQKFQEVLTRYGITFTGNLTTLREERWNGSPDTTSPSGRTTLATHDSPSLSQIIYYTNLKSINMFAEHILKMIGATKGSAGSTEEGIRVVRQYWASKGLDLKGFEMCDGSGLSRKNKITPRQLCQLLVLYKSEKSYPGFVSSLPIAGNNGGLGSMMKGTVAEDNLRAKTGTMGDVRAYAGYVKNRSGEDLAFTIIANNFTISGQEMRKKCERLMLLIAQLD